MRVEYKGGSRQWVPSLIIVTCCYSLEQFTPHTEHVSQLRRRCDEVEEFVREWLPYEEEEEELIPPAQEDVMSPHPPMIDDDACVDWSLNID